jgi:hypothetical protein
MLVLSVFRDPIKNKVSHIFVVLVEVCSKKRVFQMVIDQLGLQDIEVNGYDWHFVRKQRISLMLFSASNMTRCINFYV